MKQLLLPLLGTLRYFKPGTEWHVPRFQLARVARGGAWHAFRWLPRAIGGPRLSHMSECGTKTPTDSDGYDLGHYDTVGDMFLAGEIEPGCGRCHIVLKGYVDRAKRVGACAGNPQDFALATRRRSAKQEGPTLAHGARVVTLREDAWRSSRISGVRSSASS